MTVCGHGLWHRVKGNFSKFYFKNLQIWTGQGIRLEGRHPSPQPSTTVLSSSTNFSLQWITHTFNRWASKKKLWTHLVGIYPTNHGVSPFGNSLCRLCHPRSPNPAVQIRLHQHSQVRSSRSQGSGSRPAAVRPWGLWYPQERPHSGTQSPKAARETSRRKNPGSQRLPQALCSVEPSGH